MGGGPGEISMDSADARELSEAHLLYGDPNHPDQVQAVSVPVALQLLLSRHQQAIAAAHDVAKEGWNALESLLMARQADASRQDAPDAMIELVTDRTRLNALSVELYMSARAELCTTNTGNFARPLGEHQAIVPPKAALANGARFRGIYDVSYGASPAGAKILELSRQAGRRSGYVRSCQPRPCSWTAPSASSRLPKQAWAGLPSSGRRSYCLAEAVVRDGVERFRHNRNFESHQQSADASPASRAPPARDWHDRRCHCARLRHERADCSPSHRRDPRSTGDPDALHRWCRCGQARLDLSTRKAPAQRVGAFAQM